MLSVRIEQGVIRELLQACEYFDSQDVGLGQHFEAAFKRSLTRITQLPTSRRLYFDHYRRVLVEPFEYHLYHQVEADEIIVMALVHGRSDPSLTFSRLRRPSSNE